MPNWGTHRVKYLYYNKYLISKQFNQNDSETNAGKQVCDILRVLRKWKPKDEKKKKRFGQNKDKKKTFDADLKLV